jgi:HPt (histidine-containing phosphotransfer) domain-containing protein
MATLAEVSRERKSQLKQLLVASRKLDAVQESLEREIKRIVNRKKSVPEVSDATRLANMAYQVEGALSNMAQVITSVSNSWGAKY